MYSAIVLATGPTVVSPLVDQIKLVSPLSEVLKAEGLVLEPIGAVLALLLLEQILGDLHGIKEVFIALMQRLGGGVLIGISSGWLLSEILKKIKNEASFGIELQVTLGFIFLVYGICEYLLPESGLPASVAAGFIVGKREIIDKERLDNLIGELAQLSITVLFPLLASDVSWGELSPLGWGGGYLRINVDDNCASDFHITGNYGRGIRCKTKGVFIVASAKGDSYCCCCLSFFNKT